MKMIVNISVCNKPVKSGRIYSEEALNNAIDEYNRKQYGKIKEL